MAVRPVLTYPHPALKEKAPDVPPTDPRVAQALADLTDTLLAHPGCVGLAATQIGHAVRCLVVDVSRSNRGHESQGLLKLVDPKVLEATQWKAGREGCLSFPDLLANVKRAQKLTLEAWNEKGEKVQVRSQGFEAVALQHEMDHLDGILFLDRIRSSKDLFERRKTPTT
ncbi:MAG TPA: peptide deformylase [bacterium]|nr:peptide deformylase [bacterium]